MNLLLISLFFFFNAETNIYKMTDRSKRSIEAWQQSLIYEVLQFNTHAYLMADRMSLLRLGRDNSHDVPSLYDRTQLRNSRFQYNWRD